MQSRAKLSGTATGIILMIATMFFFSIGAGVLALLSILLGYPVVVEFFETGLVPRLPTAVLAMGVMLIAVLSLAIGLILNNGRRGQLEMMRLKYLEFPPFMSGKDGR